MKNKRYSSAIKLLLITISFIMLRLNNVYASPGGTIVKAVTKNPFVKIVIAAIIIILLPVIIYTMAKTRIAVKNTTKELYKLGKMNDNFRWIVINERAHAIITHVYAAWKKTDIEQAQNWMTDWYWQNQKLTVLEHWEEEGLKNICKLHKICSVKPLYIEYREREKGDGEGSRIVLYVTVKLEDYLIDVNTEDIVEGDKKKKELDSIWTFVLSDGQWKLSLIEESFQDLFYAKLRSDIEVANEYISSGFVFKKESIK